MPGFSQEKEQRIVSLMPSYTEIIFELGAGSRLAGISNFCNYPQGTAGIEKIGDYFTPNIEKIYSMRPDIVFAGKWKNSKAVSALKNLGINLVEISEERKIEDIFATIRIIGKNTGSEKRAGILVSGMKKELGKIKKSSKKTAKSVYAEIDRGYWTCGKNSFISDVIKKAGGKNVFSGVNMPYFQASWEDVIKAKPEIVVLINSEKEEFLKRPLAEKIPAVKSGKIITGIDKDVISRPGPRIISVIKQLKKEFDGKN